MTIAELAPTEPLGRAAPHLAPVAFRRLPDLEPGQLWLIEVAPEGEGAPSLRPALERANVVIYDRALSQIVAEALPLSGYAEAAASTDDLHDPAAARGVRFACDGWSVVRLVPAHPTQRQRLVRVRQLVEELAAAKTPSEIAVTVLGELSDGICEPTRTRLNRLDQVVVTYPRDARLTIVVAGVDAQPAARLHAVAGNGLAG